ncbi:DUF4328 domain-containing protein [Streptomyces sp. B1866]|uniref:DUF4328 domain-containing protein n=1 Tax=Streptomyces sp. B1866 TaxID=3075431 RepID=UPI0028926DD1|nr:DUF4328 domain-containing protein [Streptomyces sp. B1866]MDT3398426.1 DUF4328 domain-containing protein [Streptomyces sp. B1866]
MLCQRCQLTHPGPNGRCTNCGDATAAVSAVPLEDHGAAHGGYVPLLLRPLPVAALGAVASVMLGLVACMALLRLIADVDAYTALDDPRVLYLDKSFWDFWNLMCLLMMLGFAGAVPSFLVWFYRVRMNAEVLAPGRQRQGPGMAIGGWFIPFANCWVPKQVADDIVAASRAEAAGPPRRGTSGGRGWLPGPGVVRGWWVTWVGSGVVATFAWMLLYVARERHDLAALRAGLMLLAFGDAGLVAAAVLGVFTVRMVGGLQEARFGFARRAYPFAPPSGQLPLPPGPIPQQPAYGRMTGSVATGGQTTGTHTSTHHTSTHHTSTHHTGTHATSSSGTEAPTVPTMPSAGTGNSTPPRWASGA